jgi:hypothetical protein
MSDLPEILPLPVTSDFSKSETNLLTSSGFSGGTRMPAPGAGWGLLAPASRGVGLVVSIGRPSNLGNGPAELVSLGQTMQLLQNG